MIKLYNYNDKVKSIYSGEWIIPTDIPKEPSKRYFVYTGTKTKCTCGVKFTGGICSDWCDTNHPVENTEDLPF